MPSFSMEVLELTDKFALPRSMLAEIANPLSATDAKSGPSAWDGKPTACLQVAQQRTFARSAANASFRLIEGCCFNCWLHLSRLGGLAPPARTKAQPPSQKRTCEKWSMLSTEPQPLSMALTATVWLLALL